MVFLKVIYVLKRFWLTIEFVFRNGGKKSNVRILSWISERNTIRESTPVGTLMLVYYFHHVTGKYWDVCEFLPLVCVFVLFWLQFVYISFVLYYRFFEKNIQLLTFTFNIAWLSLFCCHRFIFSTSISGPKYFPWSFFSCSFPFCFLPP